eukprot:CAMPEP_0177737344 /NCGR_PEP_ID=MMETSP0484_2-20121128/25835_1 /TAXON_ID=354590 /ORGANISM="Rhodomonas lens, Strain RHODO" /LENGTH=675 /DNA_ID=CAMNT_0019251119 /DNA_START=165 /DNA_END=2189 /DNA_ORIENTATION=-
MAARNGYTGQVDQNDWVGAEHYEKKDRFEEFAKQQREVRNLGGEPLTIRIGPSIKSPPRPPPQDLDSANVDIVVESDEGDPTAVELARENEALMYALRELGQVSRLPENVRETHNQMFIQGIHSSPTVVEFQAPKSWKPVHILECRSSAFYLKGVTTTLFLEECENLRILADTVVKRVVLLSCRGVEVVLVDRPPPFCVVGCMDCTIALPREIKPMQVESIGCTRLSIVHVDLTVNDFAQLRHMDLYHELVEKPKAKTSGEVLPDVMKARLHSGRMMCWHAPPTTGDLGIPLPVAGVGMSLEVDYIGVKVRRLDRVAMKLGAVKVGDYLLKIDDKDVTNKSLQQIQAKLIGRCGAETTVTIARFAEVNVVETHQFPMVHWHALPNTKNMNCSTTFQRTLDTQNLAGLSLNEESGKLAGGPRLGDIGLVFGLAEDGTFRVESCVAGSPAEKCGQLRRGDVIQGIGRQPLSGLTEAQARSLSLGPPGSEVALTLLAQDLAPDNSQKWRATPLEHRRVLVRREVGSIGLQVRQSLRGLWTLHSLVLGGPAEADARLRRGDVVHSIDGVVVLGRSAAEFEALAQGPLGSQAVVAVLSAAASPRDAARPLSQFPHWRPVVLLRAPPPAGGSDVNLVPLPSTPLLHYHSLALPLPLPRAPLARPRPPQTAAGAEGVGLEVE